MPIRLDTKNARKHSDRNKAAIRKSLEAAKAGRSIVLDAGDNVLAGNGVAAEWEAMGKPIRIVESNGEELIAVKRVDLAPDSPKARQLATLDNLTADTSAYDYDADLLRAALANDPVSAALAEQDERLRELLKPMPQAETTDAGELVDRAAELQTKWQCAKGEIWTAAGHFWICGDCRDAEMWARLLKAAGIEKVNGVFTSPPYAEQRKKQYGGVPTDKYVEWWEAVQANVRANLASDGSFFVNIKPHCEDGERVLYVFDLVLAMRRKWGWRFVDELCWKKNGIPGNFGERFRNDFEPIFHFSLNNPKFLPQNVSIGGETDMQFISTSLPSRQGTGNHPRVTKQISDVKPSNVICVSVDGSGISHAAAFPVALPTFFVKAYSDTGDAWLDPFLGSGTTVIAAHREGRRGLGCEMLEKYCAVICERIEKETGETPRRVELP